MHFKLQINKNILAKRTAIQIFPAILYLMFFTLMIGAQIPSRVIVNPGFESPDETCASYFMLPQSEVPGWKTTDTGTNRIECGNTTGSIIRPIEIWANGFNGISAHGGTQLAEINANINGYLYQEVCLVANEQVSYSIWHHRRLTSGSDVFRARLEDADSTLIGETANLTSSNNSWNNFTGNLTNNGTTGLKHYGFRAISTAGGDPSVGNLIDDITITLRPLADIRRFSLPTVNENGGSSNLEVYINGTLLSTATLTLNKTGTATYLTDYTVGTPSRGTAAVNSTGRITLTLPAGDYDPNQSSGTTAGLISIPITAVNDAVADDNETVTYTVGTASNGGGGNTSLNLATQISGQSAACSLAVGSDTLTIEETKAPNVSLVKSCTSPADCTTASQISGTDLTYSIQFTNNGGSGAAGLVIVDAIPANTDYKVSSATTTAGTSGLVFATEFSNNYTASSPGSATWTYTPVSAGGGAAAGYDRNVKAIRWRVTSGTLSYVASLNTGKVGFVSRIR